MTGDTCDENRLGGSCTIHPSILSLPTIFHMETSLQSACSCRLCELKELGLSPGSGFRVLVVFHVIFWGPGFQFRKVVAYQALAPLVQLPAGHTASHCVVPASTEFKITVLAQPLEWWDFSHKSPHPTILEIMFIYLWQSGQRHM